jgi:hypothetical protein
MTEYSRCSLRDARGWTVLSVLLSLCATSHARSCRPDLIPNGSADRCSSCHVSSGGGGTRTPFGEDVRALVNSGGCADFWSEALAMMDSDGDGRTNGEELQDPDGLWSSGEAAPGDAGRVTNPGVVDEFDEPAVAAVPSALDLGVVAVGESREMNVSIRSVGELDLTFTSAAIDGATTTEFSASVTGLPAMISPGDSHIVTVSYTPDDEGPDFGSLLIEHDGVNAPSPLVIVLFGSTLPSTDTRFLRGDANLDGRVDIGDGIRLLDYLFRGGVILTCRDAADYNDSGSVDLGDPVFILNWLFRAGPTPPDPGPRDCGPDPTDDSLDCTSYLPCA